MFTIDDDYDVYNRKTLKQALALAQRLKREHPLRHVYITQFITGDNGDEATVIAEL